MRKKKGLIPKELKTMNKPAMPKLIKSIPVKKKQKKKKKLLLLFFLIHQEKMKHENNKNPQNNKVLEHIEKTDVLAVKKCKNFRSMNIQNNKETDEKNLNGEKPQSVVHSNIAIAHNSKKQYSTASVY